MGKLFIGTAVIFLLAGCAAQPPRQIVGGVYMSLQADVPEAEAGELVAAADKTIEDACNLLALEMPRHPIHAILFESGWSLRRYLSEACPDQKGHPGACFETADGHIIAIARQKDVEETKRLLRHEVVHATINEYFYDVPPWVHEGLAQYFEMGPPYHRRHPELWKDLARQIRKNDKPLLMPLVRQPAGHPLSKSEYEQAWGLMYFLLSENPYNALSLHHYLKIVRSTHTLSQFKVAFGRTPDDLEKEWREFILAPEAKD